MAVSKKLRFEVFRRDNFACRYCGNSARDGAVLEPDHVIPRARGGKDEAQNLVAACEECNAGKGATSLGAKPIDDVPQQIFQMACLERGLASDDPEGVVDLVSVIVGDIPDEERGHALQYARDWTADTLGEVPTERGVLATAAFDYYGRCSADLHALTQLVSRFLARVPRARRDDLYAEARGHCEQYRRGGRMESAVAIRAASELLLAEDEALLTSLPPEEAAEWRTYAAVLFDDSPFGMSDDEVTIKAAEVCRMVEEGRVYGEMCCGPGRFIRSCPKRAEHQTWVSPCRECEHVDVAGHHAVCGEHLGALKAGSLVSRTSDVPVSLLRHKPLSGRMERV